MTKALLRVTSLVLFTLGAYLSFVKEVPNPLVAVGILVGLGSLFISKAGAPRWPKLSPLLIGACVGLLAFFTLVRYGESLGYGLMFVAVPLILISIAAAFVAVFRD